MKKSKFSDRTENIRHVAEFKDDSLYFGISLQAGLAARVPKLRSHKRRNAIYISQLL